MTTQTTPETPTNSLAIVPHGTAWQAVPPPPLTLDQILDRILCQLDQINEQIDEINDKLRSI